MPAMPGTALETFSLIALCLYLTLKMKPCFWITFTAPCSRQKACISGSKPLENTRKLLFARVTVCSCIILLFHKPIQVKKSQFCSWEGRNFNLESLKMTIVFLKTFFYILFYFIFLDTPRKSVRMSCIESKKF